MKVKQLLKYRPSASTIGVVLGLVPLGLAIAQWILCFVVGESAEGMEIVTTGKVDSFHGVVQDRTELQRWSVYPGISAPTIFCGFLAVVFCTLAAAACFGFHRTEKKGAGVLYLFVLLLAFMAQLAALLASVARWGSGSTFEHLRWRMGSSVNLPFSIDDIRYTASISSSMESPAREPTDELIALLFVGLAANATIAISFVYHYFYIEEVHGQTVSVVGRDAMKWIISVSSTGTSRTWNAASGGYSMVQNALMRRVVKVRQAGTNDLYKEMELVERTKEELLRSIANVFDVEVDDIVELIKDGDTAIESDPDVYRLLAGSKVEFSLIGGSRAVESGSQPPDSDLV